MADKLYPKMKSLDFLQSKNNFKWFTLYKSWIKWHRINEFDTLFEQFEPFFIRPPSVAITRIAVSGMIITTYDVSFTYSKDEKESEKKMVIMIILFGNVMKLFRSVRRWKLNFCARILIFFTENLLAVGSSEGFIAFYNVDSSIVEPIFIADQMCSVLDIQFSKHGNIKNFILFLYLLGWLQNGSK